MLPEQKFPKEKGQPFRKREGKPYAIKSEQLGHENCQRQDSRSAAEGRQTQGSLLTAGNAEQGGSQKIYPCKQKADKVKPDSAGSHCLEGGISCAVEDSGQPGGEQKG